jgi:hypothetical protein
MVPSREGVAASKLRISDVKVGFKETSPMRARLRIPSGNLGFGEEFGRSSEDRPSTDFF